MRVFFILSLAMVAMTSCMHPPDSTVLLPKNAVIDPSLRHHVEQFERICIPFALHETELTLKDDMALLTRQMADQGFEPYERPINCASPAGARWHPTQEFKHQTALLGTYKFKWPRKRKKVSRPGGSCEYVFKASPDQIAELKAAMLSHDDRWMEPTERLESRTFVPMKSRGQFTVFNPGNVSPQRLLTLLLVEESSEFYLSKRFNYDSSTDKVSDEHIVLKVKGENHDGPLGPFMPINCPPVAR